MSVVWILQGNKNVTCRSQHSTVTAYAVVACVENCHRTVQHALRLSEQKAGVLDNDRERLVGRVNNDR